MNPAVNPAFILMVILAGCAGRPGNSSPIQEEKAPTWNPGEMWTYAVQSRWEGNYSTTLEVLRSVAWKGGSGTVYEVRETRSIGEPPEPLRYFDSISLHEVFGCERTPPPVGCQVDTSEIDFPLRDAKTWTWVCCGDAVFSYRSFAARAPQYDTGDPVGKEWSIVTVKLGFAAADHKVGLFDVSVGNWVERFTYDSNGDVTVHHKLLEYHRATQ